MCAQIGAHKERRVDSLYLSDGPTASESEERDKKCSAREDAITNRMPLTPLVRTDTELSYIC